MKSNSENRSRSIATLLVIMSAALAVLLATPVGANQSVEYAQRHDHAPSVPHEQDGGTAAMPGQPRNVHVFTDLNRSENATLIWKAPASDGGTPVTSYIVQWKSGDQAYDESRQATTSATQYGFDNLIHGTEYTFRVRAMNEQGIGEPSADVTYLHRTSLGKLKDFAREHVVEANEAEHPWLRPTWDYLTAVDDRLQITYDAGGSRVINGCSGYEEGLVKCKVFNMKINPGHVEEAFVIVHEMAHVYTLSNDIDNVGGTPLPEAAGILYFGMLPASGSLNDGCILSYEYHADLLGVAITGHDSPSYWRNCNPGFMAGETDPLTDTALGVAKAVSANNMPDWFTQRYGREDDNLNLELLWADMQPLDLNDYDVLAFMLRNQFGGYCDVTTISSAPTANTPTPITNPWRDGGCAPTMPQNLRATTGAQEINVTWEAPTSIGGAQLNAHQIQWASGDQEYNRSRSRMVFEATSTSYTISNLVTDTEYRVRVAYRNQFGIGAYAEITATPGGNNPATGVPTISGTAQVEQTLSADTSAIADADGLDNATFSYQWIANDGNSDLDILGATSQTYTLEAAQQGKTIKVRVTFIDDRNNEETLTSVPTTAVAAKPNSPATGLPFISGTAQVRQTLTADVSGIVDADGLDGASYNYQWIRNDSGTDSDIVGATTSTYEVKDADRGMTIKVRVSFTDDRNNQESLISQPTAPVVASPPDEPQHVRVSPHDPQSLDVSWEPPASDGGFPIIGYKVQWKETGDSWDAPADFSEVEVTGTTHTIGGLTEGVEYAVRVIGVNSVGDGMPSTEQTGTPRETTPPERYGYPKASGGTLTLNYNEALDGSSIPAVEAFVLSVVGEDDSFTWLSEEAVRTIEMVSVSGSTVTLTLETAVVATDYVVLAYTPPADAEAARIRDLAGNAAAGFPGTQVIYSRATGAPTISGTARVGETLTASTSGIADADGLTNVSYGYQWIRTDSGTDADIAGETAQTYELADDDQGKTIKVRVTFTDDADNDETLTSDATAEVAPRANREPTGLPTITGTAQVGQTLTADTSAISDEDGLDNATFSYQWIRSDGGTDADIPGATARTFELSDDDEGKAIRVRVTFTDDANNEETLTSQATETVSAAYLWSATMTVGVSGDNAGYSLFHKIGELSSTKFFINGTGYSVWLILHDANYLYLRLSIDAPADLKLHTGDREFAVADAVTVSGQNSTMYKWPRGDVSWSDGETVEVALTLAETAAENSAPTGLPTITGVAQVGETVTADTTGIADADGLTNVSYGYQWIRTDSGTDADIAGETAQTYELADDDQGKTIKVRVTFTDDADNDETLTSDATAEVAPRANREPTGLPTITGTAQVGQTLTADTSAISDEDGLDNATFSYQWIRSDGNADTGIDGATAQTYTLRTADEGQAIKVRVTFRDDADNEESLTSTATGTVAPKPNSAATGRPPSATPRGWAKP